MWKLIDKKSGKELIIGAQVTTFRGETCVIDDLCPPHKPSSTGRVFVKFSDAEHQAGFFPSVIGAAFVEA